METWKILTELIGIGFAAICFILFIADIAKAIYHQFKGTPYEWYTIKVLKEKREWWKWVLAVGVFCVGVYWIAQLAAVGDADFRAEKQQPEYTAFYECEYKISGTNRTSGTGTVLITRKNNHLTADVLFTEHGFVKLGFLMEDRENFVYGDLKEDGYAEIHIGVGPVSPETIQFCDDKFYYYGEQCEWCGILLPSEYIYDDGGNKCPTCLYKDYEYMNSAGIWKCGVCNDLFTIGEDDLNPCPWCAAHE